MRLKKGGKVYIACAEGFQHPTVEEIVNFWKILFELCGFKKSVIILQGWLDMVIQFILLKIVRETDEEKCHFYQFILKMETSQHAVTVGAMRWCIFFPWAGKLSWAPVLTSNGLISEDEELEQMQTNVLKGWFQQMMPTQWSALLTYSMSARQMRIWLRAPSVWKYQRHSDFPFCLLLQITFFFLDIFLPWFFFFNYHLCFSMLSDIKIFQFTLTFFKIGCFFILISAINFP